jgi:putative hydrolase
MYDLHIHSSYSDGTGRVEDIVRKAKERRLKAIAIVDHSIDHKFGLTEAKARRRQEEIERFSSKYDIDVLSGIECGILANGELAIPDFKFDLIIASVHDQLSTAEYYRRIIQCLKRNDLEVLGHLHSNLFCSVNEDLERDLEIIDLLEEGEIAIEINVAHESPPEDFLQLCNGRRLKYSVGSDTHVLGRVGDVSKGFKLARRYLNRGIFLLEGKG